jgi:DNA anti-recombination protein RmuC
MNHIIEIVGVTVVTLIFLFLWMKRNENNILSVAPSILITTGIFFTFLGITIGLWNFNIDNVDSSLPALLNGIKTAFMASVLGVFFALIFKFIELKPKETISETPEGQTIDDLVANQRIQTSSLNELNNGIQQLIKSIADPISDSSLVAQIKLMRMDNNEKIDALRKDFQEFATTMAENNSKAFIQALEEVIRDFNSKLTEQFGDNFKQLNEAVGQTVQWQENYKTQMQESIEILTRITSILSKQSEDYEIVVSRSVHFSQHANDMKNIIEAINQQKIQMEVIIKSLADMVKTTSEELPKIGQKTNEMIEKIAHSSNSLIQNMKTHNDNLSNFMDRQFKSLDENNNKIIENIAKNNTYVVNQLNDSMKQSSDEIQKQVHILDKELENALTNSLETLGQQLASLSNQFVKDYTPLTKKLREILEIASKVK